MSGASDATAPARDGSGRDGRERMRSDVLRGLRREQKEIAPKYFYDRKGSELFEEITRLPEYYLTRAELKILRGPVRPWIRSVGPRSLVELGAGSARKTRVILDAMLQSHAEVAFIPVDVSADFLDEAAAEVSRDYPAVAVRPVVADISQPLNLKDGLQHPVLFALLGSTLGNFSAGAAGRLLGNVRRGMGREDFLMLGLDLRPGEGKPVRVLEAAYDDDAGVTKRFNLNVLEVLNRDLGANFEPSAFRHRAFYNDADDRIEMHLVSKVEQTVRIPDITPKGTLVHFQEGESIRTEISCKYDRQTLDGLFTDVGLELVGWFSDPKGAYAMALGRRSHTGE